MISSNLWKSGLQKAPRQNWVQINSSLKMSEIWLRNLSWSLVTAHRYLSGQKFFVKP